MALRNRIAYRLLPALLLVQLAAALPGFAAETGAASRYPLLIIRPAGQTFGAAVAGICYEIGEESELHEFQITMKSTAAELAVQMRQVSPRFIVLMDNTAIDLYKAYLATRSDTSGCIPSIACMAINLEHSIKGIVACSGVEYEMPIFISLVNLRSLLTSPIKRVGIVHRRFMDEFITRNRELCKQEEFELVEYPLADTLADIAKAVSGGLKELFESKQVDALWVANDNVLLRTEVLQKVWIPLVRKYKKPVIVGAKSLVNPMLDFGTFAVLPDPFALGTQVAIRISEDAGQNCAEIESTVDVPYSVQKYLNLSQIQAISSVNQDPMGRVDSVLIKPKETQEGIRIQGYEENESQKYNLSLASLLNITVTSVSKKAENLQDIASSIYVITQEDIHRSGATRLQDVLNMVPGVWIADQSYFTPSSGIRNSAEWWIGTVNALIDGVSMIHPGIGSFLFEAAKTPLQEIERIEVIKGPGGTIYGANSTTGVINIFTKRPNTTQGLQAYLNGGTRSYFEPGMRYSHQLTNAPVWVSGSLNLKTHHGYSKNDDFIGDSLLVSGKSLKTKEDTTAWIKNKFNNNDEGKHIEGSGHLDITAQPNKKIKLNGSLWYDFLRTREYATLDRGYPESPGTPLGDSIWLAKFTNWQLTANNRLDYTFSENHAAFANYYYLYNCMNIPIRKNGILNSNYFLSELELQDNATLFADHQIRSALSYGANVRMVGYRNHSRPDGVMIFTDTNRTEFIFAGFLQNTLSLSRFADLTVGAKAETWTLVSPKPEISPTFRMALKPTYGVTGWAAWSRSVTTPGYFDKYLELRQFAMPPAWYFIMPQQLGGMGMDPAKVPPGAGKYIALASESKYLKPSEYTTSEGGIRLGLIPHASLDFSCYYTLYRNKVHNVGPDMTLRTIVPSKIFPGDSIIPISRMNASKGRIYGTETVIKYNPANFLVVELSHAWWKLIEEGQILPTTGEVYVTGKGAETTTPAHIVRGRLYLNLPHDLFFTLNAIWNSPYKNVESYDYIHQDYLQANQGGTVKELPRAKVKFTISVEKMFLHKKVGVQIWAKNLMIGRGADGYPEFLDDAIESYTPYRVTYPQGLSPLFGGGITVRF